MWLALKIMAFRPPNCSPALPCYSVVNNGIIGKGKCHHMTIRVHLTAFSCLLCEAQALSNLHLYFFLCVCTHDASSHETEAHAHHWKKKEREKVLRRTSRVQGEPPKPIGDRPAGADDSSKYSGSRMPRLNSLVGTVHPAHSSSEVAGLRRTVSRPTQLPST